MRTIHGACHCGNIRFRFGWPLAEHEIPVRACGCDFCTKHHGVYTSHPEATLEVEILDESEVSNYRFGTKTADFVVCARCGVLPVVTSVIDNNLFAVVNVNTFDDVDRAHLMPKSTNFGGESVESRLARRQGSWIPNVIVSYGAPPETGIDGASSF